MHFQKYIHVRSTCMFKIYACIYHDALWIMYVFLKYMHVTNTFMLEIYRCQNMHVEIYACQKFMHAIYASYFCIVWAQNISTVSRMIVLHKKVPWIMNFKNQLFHSNSFFSSNNILKFGNKSVLENIIFVSKSIIRQVLSIFYGWFSVNLDGNETCRSVTGNLNISTFWANKYGRYI